MNILQVIDWKRAVLAVAVFALIASAGFLGTRAFFSDTETSEGNVFAAGSLDLEVGIENRGSEGGNDPLAPQSLPNNGALFTFADLIPGDMDTGHFKLESSQDAWACIAADISANYENTRLDVEDDAGDDSAGTGPNGGELSEFMQIAIWEANGLGNSDGLVGPNEQETLQIMSLEDFANGDYYTLQDSSTDGGDNPLLDGQEYNHEFAYCFGELSLSGTELMCDGGVFGGDSNKAQTDSAEVTIHFYAEQMQNNDSFVCSSLTVDGARDTVGADLASYVAPSSCDITVETGVGDHDTITDAIEAASDGDTICVAGLDYSRSWESNNSISGSPEPGPNQGILVDKEVAIVSTTGPANHTISAGLVIDADNVTIRGFTLTPLDVQHGVHPTAIYLDNSHSGITIADNDIDGAGVAGNIRGIITEIGQTYNNVSIENNEIHDFLTGIYLNPHFGTIVIENNDIDNNTAGIGGLNGATVRNNEFEHSSAGSEAIGIDSTFDANVATVNFNNFLDGTMINAYGTITTTVNAEDNFFNVSPAAQTNDPIIDTDPDATSQYAHN